MFILFHLFLECLGQTYTFLNLDIGIHILQTLQSTSEPNSKIIVKLEQEIFDSTQLLICDSEITLLKENCIYDINSFDLKKNTQVLQLVQGQKLEKYQEQLLSMKQFNKSPQVVGTYSNHISNYSITISIMNILECASLCQNNGICKNGMCECKEGYFGADCSIVALDITLQSLYHKDQFYQSRFWKQIILFLKFQVYFNIKECNQQSCSLNIKFNQVGKYRQICYAEDWYEEPKRILLQNVIEKKEIKINDVQSCLSKIKNEMLSPQLFSYYIFHFETECEISPQSNNQDTKSILIIVIITVGVSISLCCCIVCYNG